MTDQPALFGVPQQQTTSDDYYTPEWLFDRLGLRFDLDVAAPPNGVPWIPADRYLTMADDGLATPWHGRVWCNPPYSSPGLWVDKWLVHGNGLLLVPFAKSNWFARLWAAPVALCHPELGSRFKFVGGAISYPIVLAAIGDDNVTALHAAGIGAVRALEARP